MRADQKTEALAVPQHAIGSPVEDQEPSVLEADYASLKHLTTELQAALQEVSALSSRPGLDIKVKR